MIQAVLDKKENLTTKGDEEGYVTLHFAAYSGSLQVVLQLLEYDKYAAYVGDKGGKTALHIAASLGKADIVNDNNSLHRFL